MRLFLMSIVLTVLCPLSSWAVPFEFNVEDGKLGTYFFRISDDPAKNDEIFYKFTNSLEWSLLLQGRLSGLFLPTPVVINNLPARIKILKMSSFYMTVISDGQLNIITPEVAPAGEGRYKLPDLDAQDLVSSNGFEFKNQMFRVISYQTANGPKTILLRRSDGKFRLLGKQIFSDLSKIELKNSTLLVPGLSLKFDLSTFETTPATNFENLRKIREESEQLRKDLESKIYAQDSAVNALVNSYRELKTNTSAKPRVLLGMGPSGVGKSYTAEVFADLKAQGRVMTIKGNEFNSHAGSLDYMKLLGSARGTSGEAEGELIKWLKSIDGQNGVLIIDEGDKMHPEIWLKLMEFLNTGILTASDGKKLQARDLIIFITTNRGVSRMFPSSSKNWTQQQLNERTASLTQDQLKSYYLQKEGLDDKFVLPPEVLNRIDEYIPYAPLTAEAAIEITKKIAKDLDAQYEINYAIHFETDQAVLREIALADFNGSVDGRAVKKKVAKIYSDALHAAADKLGLNAEGTMHLQVSIDPHGQKFLQVSVGDRSLQLAPLSQQKVSPVNDPAQAARLLNMETELKKEVIGQDEAMHAIAAAAIAHGGLAENERPLIVFLGGISGNGKTETGRALAKVRYGSAERLAIIPLGGVQDQAQFDNIFGISAQFQGGNIERIFEKSLREIPEGGVLIFDEISNMGGKNREMKTSLMMKFYDLFEQGRYISPIDGRVYELGKYTLALTGNDGENDFRGMTSDDLLLATWNENKSQDKVRRMLLESGWPTALINRIAVKVLLKPILSTEIGPISQKLLDREIRNFEKQNPGVKVNAPKNFASQLAQSFFAPDQGARGLRDVLETKMRSALVTDLLKAKAAQVQNGPIDLNLSLTDTKHAKPYLTSHSKDREINLKVTSSQVGAPEQVQIEDVTALGTAEVLLNGDNAKLVSYHEAGHAVVGEHTAFITIRGGRTGDLEYYGYAREDLSKRDYLNMDRKHVILLVAKLWAGRKAQELAGYTADNGWTQDLAQIRQALTSFLLKSGLEREFVGVAVNSQGEIQMSPAMHARLEQRMSAMEKEGEQLAEKILIEKWPLVRSVVSELMVKGEISGSRFQELEKVSPTLRYRSPPGLIILCEGVYN